MSITLTDFRKISRAEHIDAMTSDEFAGTKVYYFIDDESIATPWIGIDRTGELKQRAFDTKHELFDWLRNGDMVVDDNPVGGRTHGFPNGEGTGLAFSIDDQSTLFEAVPGPLFAEDDPMAILQQANGNGSTPPEKELDEIFGPAAPVTFKEITEGVAEVMEDPALMPVPELKKTIELAEAEWLRLYRRHAVADAKLQAKLQEYQQTNADLISEQKTAKLELNTFALALKKFAAEYGERTGDKKFDAYVTMQESTDITWDEPAVIGWCTKNYPEALIDPSVILDEKRFTDYVKDLIKRKQALPPSVVVTPKWSAKLSTKVEVPELGTQEEIPA